MDVKDSAEISKTDHLRSMGSDVIFKPQGQYYKRPQNIRNQPLLRDQNQYMPNRGKGTPQQMQYLILKDDIIERFDFEAVSLDIWRHFKSWYDCDLALLRFIKPDKVNTN